MKLLNPRCKDCAHFEELFFGNGKSAYIGRCCNEKSIKSRPVHAGEKATKCKDYEPKGDDTCQEAKKHGGVMSNR